MNRIYSTALCACLMLLSQGKLLCQDFWEPANAGLSGADVIAFFPDDAGGILALTDVGLYRSDDSGQTWRQLPSVHPEYPQSATLSADGRFYVTTWDSLYTSRDFGQSWSARAFDTTMPGTLVGADSLGYVYGVRNGLRRSADGGETWQTVIDRSRLSNHNVTASLGVSDLLLVVAEKVLLVSSDSGASWDSVTGPRYNGQAVNYYAAAVLPGGVILASTSRGLYRSADRAVNWELIDSLAVGRFHAGADRKVYQIFGSIPGYVDMGASRKEGLSVSSDTGRTWSIIRNGWIRSVRADPSGVLVVSTGLGVERSVDGGRNWHTADQGLTNFHPGRIAQGPGGMLVVSHEQVPAFSSNDGASWVLEENGSIGVTRGVFSDGSLVSVGRFIPHGETGTIDRSTDRGHTWSIVAADLIGEPTAIFRSSSGEMYVGTGQNLGFGSGSGSIYRSGDLGATWDSIGFDRPVKEIAVKRSGEIFALSYWFTDTPHGLSGYGALHRSTDGGATWQTLNDTIDATELVIDRNGVLYMDFDYRYVSFTGGTPHVVIDHSVLRSTDNGDTWTSSLLPFTGYGSIECLAIDSAGAIYAGSYGQGIFRSMDEGRTWQQLNSGLKNLRINSLTVTPAGYVVATTFLNGIYRSRLPQLPASGIQPDAEPRSFPNPTTGLTTLLFDNPSDAVVTIDLYSLAGERIATLLNARRSAGRQEIQFDMSGLADGVYLYQIRSGESVMSGRVTLLRSQP